MKLTEPQEVLAVGNDEVIAALLKIVVLAAARCVVLTALPGSDILVFV